MTVTTKPRWTQRLVELASAPMQWVERARGRKRITLLFLYAMILSVVAFSLWWGQSLRSLPDIGDPFDAAEYRATPVTEADNAFPIYVQAAAGLNTLSTAHRTEIYKVLAAPWPSVKPEVREALQVHREPLLTWKRATERPGMDVLGDHWSALNDARIVFPILAMLEGARLGDQGDMAGAWSWYAAVLRSQRHILTLAESGTHSGRLGYHPAILPGILSAIPRWAADPRVDAKLLRLALADAQAIDTTIPSFASSLRGTYRWAISHLDARLATDQAFIREDEWYKATPMYWPGVKFLRREPERSRRILRLIHTNLAAHVDDPPSRRPRLVPPGIFDVGIDPSGTDPSRRITPQELARQIDASLLPKYLANGVDVLIDINREQGARATILIELATQLYEREHGSPPRVYEDLIGPYLDKLPAGAVGPSAP